MLALLWRKNGDALSFTPDFFSPKPDDMCTNTGAECLDDNGHEFLDALPKRLRFRPHLAEMRKRLLIGLFIYAARERAQRTASKKLVKPLNRFGTGVKSVLGNVFRDTRKIGRFSFLQRWLFLRRGRRARYALVQRWDFWFFLGCLFVLSNDLVD